MVLGESSSRVSKYNFHEHTLSVVMPVRFPSEHVTNLIKVASECHESGIELIVVMDTAPSFSIDFSLRNQLEELGAKVLIGAFGNPGDARNLGISNSSKEWLMFWDVDDEPNIGRIEIAIHNFPRGIDLAIGGFSVSHVRNSPKLTVVENGELVNENQVAWDPGIWRMVFRRQFIQNIFFPSLRLGEDLVFICRTLLKHPKVIFVQESLYTYRKGNLNQVTIASSNMEKASNQYKALIALAHLDYVLHENCEMCELVRRIEWKLGLSFLSRLGVVGLIVYPISFREKYFLLSTLWKLGSGRNWKYACELYEKQKRSSYK